MAASSSGAAAPAAAAGAPPHLQLTRIRTLMPNTIIHCQKSDTRGRPRESARLEGGKWAPMAIRASGKRCRRCECRQRATAPSCHQKLPAAAGTRDSVGSKGRLPSRQSLPRGQPTFSSNSPPCPALLARCHNAMPAPPL